MSTADLIMGHGASVGFARGYAVGYARGLAIGEARGEVKGKIQLIEQLAGLEAMPAAKFKAMTLGELKDCFTALEQQHWMWLKQSFALLA